MTVGSYRSTKLTAKFHPVLQGLIRWEMLFKTAVNLAKTLKIPQKKTGRNWSVRVCRCKIWKHWSIMFSFHFMKNKICNAHKPKDVSLVLL